MGPDKSAENTQNAQTIIRPICLPNLSAQAQKFLIPIKKSVIGL